jgi:membrane protein YdbS with pleckstrin-like domain
MDTESGEQIYFHGHPSWRSILDFYFKGLLVAIVAGAIAGVVTRIADHKVKVAVVAAVVGVVLVVTVVLGLIKRIQTTYTITSRRLTIRSGILSREMHEARLERVQNVNFTQSLFERILHVGTVDFDTAASSGFDFKFRGVGDPHGIVQIVDQAVQAIQSGTAPAVGTQAPIAPPPPPAHAPGSDAV